MVTVPPEVNKPCLSLRRKSILSCHPCKEGSLVTFGEPCKTKHMLWLSNKWKYQNFHGSQTLSYGMPVPSILTLDQKSLKVHSPFPISSILVGQSSLAIMLNIVSSWNILRLRHGFFMKHICCCYLINRSHVNFWYDIVHPIVFAGHHMVLWYFIYPGARLKMLKISYLFPRIFFTPLCF